MKNAHKEDIYKWASLQADLLKENKYDELDIENIIYEFEKLGNLGKNTLVDKFYSIITRFILWYYRTNEDNESWKCDIEQYRKIIDNLIKESPSLEEQLPSLLENAYAIVFIEFNAPKNNHDLITTIPSVCPYTLEQIMDKQYYPPERKESSKRNNELTTNSVSNVILLSNLEKTVRIIKNTHNADAVIITIVQKDGHIKTTSTGLNPIELRNIFNLGIKDSYYAEYE
jgi:hypothetical protein